MNPQDPLSQLRDIHMPGPVDWWPLAPGWWVLGFLFLTAIIFCAYQYWQFIRKNRYRKATAKTIENFYAEYQKDQNLNRYFEKALAVLRQCAIQAYGREKVAGLQGIHWLKFLDATLATKQSNPQPFVNGVGQVIVAAPYQKTPVVDLKPIHELIVFWCLKHRNKTSLIVSQNIQGAATHAAI